MNKGQVIQIAIEVRDIYQSEIDDADSSDEDDEAFAGNQTEIREWFDFCSENVNKAEKLWDKDTKLEHLSYK